MNEKSEKLKDKKGEFVHKGELSWQETYDGLKELIMSRAQPGATPRGDFQVLQSEFKDYTTDGELIIKYPVFEWQCNGLDVVQGGMLGYMADAAFGALGFMSFGRGHVASIDMTSNFLRGVDITVPFLTAHAHVITKGKTIAHMECKLYNPDGKLVFHATTNMMKVVK